MQLPLIDDARSIQKAISVVLNSLAAGTLDATQARAMLYGLQIAATNARHIASQSSEQVEATTSRSETVAVDEPVAAAEPPAEEEIAAAVASPQADIVPAVPPQQDAVAGISQQQPLTPEVESALALGASDEAPMIVAVQQEKRQEDTAHAVRNPAPPARFRDYTEIRRERMRALGHRRPPVTL